MKLKKMLDVVLLQRGIVAGKLQRVACEKAVAEITSELPWIRVLV